MLRGCYVVFLAIRERREGEGLHVKKKFEEKKLRKIQEQQRSNQLSM